MFPVIFVARIIHGTVVRNVPFFKADITQPISFQKFSFVTWICIFLNIGREGVVLSYRIHKPSYFCRLFVKNYLKHTWNNILCLPFSYVFQKKTSLLTRSALWLLFHVLRRVRTCNFGQVPQFIIKVSCNQKSHFSKQFFIYQWHKKYTIWTWFNF